METPYRRQRLLEELLAHRPATQKNRPVFMALELNGEAERLLRGSVEEVLAACASLPKLEFVLVVGQTP